MKEKKCGSVCRGAYQCPRANFNPETRVGPHDCSIAFPRRYRRLGPIRLRTTGGRILKIEIGER